MRESGRSLLHSSLAAVLALAWAGVTPVPAWAQDVEEAVPVAQGPGGEESQGEPAAPAAPAGDAAEEPASTVSGWFRFDVDSLGPQFWFGATHEVGGLTIASDIYVDDFFAELDVGFPLTFGNLTITPAAGIGFDFQNYEVASVVAPQLFTSYTQGPIYFDSWLLVFFNSPFADDVRDLVYIRAFLVYKLDEIFAVGPQIETSFFLNESVDGAGDDGLAALPLGAQVQVGYGKNTTLGLFIGYDTQYEGDGDSATEDGYGLTGRFTIIQTW